MEFCLISVSVETLRCINELRIEALNLDFGFMEIQLCYSLDEMSD